MTDWMLKDLKIKNNQGGGNYMKDILKKANNFPYACQKIPDKAWDSLDFDEQITYCSYCKLMCPYGRKLVQYNKKPEKDDVYAVDDILHQSKKATDKVKSEIGATDKVRPKFIVDFDGEEFEKHCRAYVDYYRDEITKFAKEIYYLNEDPKARKKHARMLFSLLHLGFSSYLQARKDKEKE